ncbi:DUF202 domain-containing protein [Streptomyces sp. KM273126]|nr:DUF202 domain-containing protein [Streptomyces sp. KM273126]
MADRDTGLANERTALAWQRTAPSPTWGEPGHGDAAQPMGLTVLEVTEGVLLPLTCRPEKEGNAPVRARAVHRNRHSAPIRLK